MGAIVVVLIGTGPDGGGLGQQPHRHDLVEAINGAPQPTSSAGAGLPASSISAGSRCRWPSLRGYTVAMTFLDPVCTTDCPVIAQEFKAANQMLGSSARKVRFVAIAANPQYHSVTALDDFDRAGGAGLAVELAVPHRFDVHPGLGSELLRRCGRPTAWPAQ